MKITDNIDSYGPIGFPASIIDRRSYLDVTRGYCFGFRSPMLLCLILGGIRYPKVNLIPLVQLLQVRS